LLSSAINVNPDYAACTSRFWENSASIRPGRRSIAELRRSVELEPRDPGTHAPLAKALSAKGLNAEADDEMRKAQHPQMSRNERTRNDQKGIINELDLPTISSKRCVVRDSRDLCEIASAGSSARPKSR